MKIRWRFGIIAGVFLAIFSLYPQMKLIYMRGGEWNGHYAYNDIDEVAYAGYVKALIDGRPRKNDPYTGIDDTQANPQPESLFSIQFAAPYTIAIPARILGIGAPWAMTLAGAFAAFCAALALFWLIRMVTGDDWFAMSGSLAVLVGGALFAGEGAVSEVFFDGFSYPYFPGFRRYIPAMAFPAFFGLVGVVWKLVGNQRPMVDDHRSDIRTSSPPFLLVGLSIAAFSYCVFSYFYVWTTGVAWLGCLGVVWLIARPDGVLADIKRLALLGVGCIAILAPYAYLLSQRSHTMDDVQLLVRTHAPDLTRPPESIAFVVIVVLVIGCILRMFEFRDRRILFTASLAAAVVVVFNQQIITGQSLQPIHYQVFIGNYVAGLSLVLTLGMIWQFIANERPRFTRIAAAGLAVIAVTWGFVECHFTVRVLDDVNILRDEAMPAGRKLTELAVGQADMHSQVILPFDIAVGDDLPTIAPQSVLWARHQHVFAGVTWQENKERYYQYLYYLGVDERSLADGMKYNSDFVSIIALFGWGRHTDRLNAGFKPLTNGEIDAEATIYGQYIKNFDPRTAGNRPLDYALVRADSPPNWEHIDKWYDRGAGEEVGKFIIYTLKVRQ